MHELSSGEVLARSIMLIIAFKGLKAAACHMRGATRGSEKCLLMHPQSPAKHANESTEVALKVKWVWRKRNFINQNKWSDSEGKRKQKVNFTEAKTAVRIQLWHFILPPGCSVQIYVNQMKEKDFYNHTKNVTATLSLISRTNTHTHTHTHTHS